MTHAALAACLVVPGCADTLDPEPELAARADSSAAGYHMGVTRAESPPLIAAFFHLLRDEWLARSATSGRAGPGEMQPARRAPAARELPRFAADSARRAGTGSDSLSRPVRRQRAMDTVAAAEPDTSLLPDSVDAGEFMTYNPRRKSVSLRLIAGYNGHNDALNINGGAHGSQTFTIPVGWRVEALFINEDRELPHSAIVVEEASPIPMTAPPAAFPGAFTGKLQEGLLEGASDEMSFTVSAPGSYLIMCGVPGHAQGGMWIRLIGAAATAVPAHTER